jgi:hypothetical protein
MRTLRLVAKGGTEVYRIRPMSMNLQDKEAAERSFALLIDLGEPEAALETVKRAALKQAKAGESGALEEGLAKRWARLADVLGEVQLKLEDTPRQDAEPLPEGVVGG